MSTVTKIREFFQQFEDVEAAVIKCGTASVLYVDNDTLTPASFIVTTRLMEAIRDWATDMCLPTDKLTVVIFREDNIEDCHDGN